MPVFGVLACPFLLLFMLVEGAVREVRCELNGRACFGSFRDDASLPHAQGRRLQSIHLRPASLGPHLSTFSFRQQTNTKSHPPTPRAYPPHYGVTPHPHKPAIADSRQAALAGLGPVNMARVYADVNQQMPRAYWDYDSVNISWGVLENYEVVRKIGESRHLLSMASDGH